jgi:hypothetical protein
VKGLRYKLIVGSGPSSRKKHMAGTIWDGTISSCIWDFPASHEASHGAHVSSLRLITPPKALAKALVEDVHLLGSKREEL